MGGLVLQRFWHFDYDTASLNVELSVWVHVKSFGGGISN